MLRALELELLVVICDFDTTDGILRQICFEVQIDSRVPEALSEDGKNLWLVP